MILSPKFSVARGFGKFFELERLNLEKIRRQRCGRFCEVRAAT